MLELNLSLLFLIFARTLAMLQVAPVISAPGISYMARAGLSFFVAALILPMVQTQGYVIPTSIIEFVLFLFIEVVIGLILGFYLVIIFMIFELAAQMFSMQMGFAAAEMFDPISNSETPLIGQLLNLGAFLIFIQTFGLQKLFLMGVEGSFMHLNAHTLLFSPEPLMQTMVKAMASTFGQSLLMALPMMGSLFMLSISLGLMAKAAPQMNLLMVGFPLQIGLGLFVLMMTIPALFNYFIMLLDQSWDAMGRLILGMRGS